jgi:acetolactate synthase I/III small subunit
VLVDNEVGILSKISGLLSARGFNIDSLTVSETDVKELSRMTISVNGQPAQIVQCRRQLEDLVNVWAVVDYTDVWHLNRELVLMKVSTGPKDETEGEEDTKATTTTTSSSTTTNDTDVSDAGQINDPVILNHFRRAAVLEMAKMYDAKVIDIGAEHLVLELVSWSRRCDAFIKMMQQFGVLECVRSGMIVMARSRVGGQEEKRSIREVVDLASLPPS